MLNGKDKISIQIEVPFSVHTYFRVHQMNLRKQGIKKTMKQIYTEHLIETVGK